MRENSKSCSLVYILKKPSQFSSISFSFFSVNSSSSIVSFITHHQSRKGSVNGQDRDREREREGSRKEERMRETERGGRKKRKEYINGGLRGMMERSIRGRNEAKTVREKERKSPA